MMEKNTTPTEQIDFALDVMNDMLVEGWTIVPRDYVISAIDKLLDRRIELKE